jgi:hypothetical protein
MPLKPVARLRMGDAVGNEDRVLYVLLSDAVVKPSGTVSASVAVMPRAEGDEPRAERRTWLHGRFATVHVVDRAHRSEPAALAA